MEAESSQRLLINQNGRVECTINSNPFPSVYWKLNGQFIDQTNTEDRYTFSTQMIVEPEKPGFEHAEIAILEVRDVIAEDAGSYECFATVDSIGSTDTLTIAVLVQVPPEWTVQPEDVQGVEGSSVTIQCAASGNPDPTYTWTDQSGQAITPVEGKYELVDDGEFFTIHNLESADDQTYVCTASNDAINSTTTTEITDPVRLEVLIPPALNAQDNETVIEGELFSMDCIITRPDATGTLSWRRYGITEDDIVNEGTWNLDSRVSVTRKDEGRTLTLSLSPSNYDHSGGWTCFVESDAGDAHVTHYLSVESIPFIDRSETPSRVLSWPGNLVNMSCVVNGFPYPTIRWYIVQDERYIRVNATEHIQFLPNQPRGTSVMSITPTEADFVPYYCEGVNKHGDVRERIELVEGGFPSEPQNVRLTDVTSSTIRVLYDEPENDGGFGIEYYVVMYNSGFDSLNETRKYDNITNVVLDGLAGNTRYQVWVAAENYRGVGIYSTGKYATTELNTVTTVVTTVTAGPSISAPAKPRITSDDDSEYAEKYILTWEPPQDNGGSAITYYHIEYAQVDGPDDDELGSRPANEFEVMYTETQATLQPLNPNKYYLVELKARNSQGDSQPAKLNFKTRGGFDFPTEKPYRPEQQIGALGTTEIVAIVVACFIILLILIDVCCFCMNDCGVLMFICVNCCGKASPSSKDEIEMGEEEYGHSKASSQPKSALKVDDGENCITTDEITASTSEPGGTKPSTPPGDGPPTYQPVENGKPEDVEAPAPETTPQAESEPLMNKDGDYYDDDVSSYRYADKKPGASDC
ncbi:neural cell adhesion molecule 1-like [Lytechinus variegatus]|uniref:neural cell adhesion molecule 1-like n=1 Tax=Lytechinus variegatus TaxID=7654 RepID=UPI001BB163EE|nr:neural cell adhesion molecule 1-like [Lytechinus variegatus]